MKIEYDKQIDQKERLIIELQNQITLLMLKDENILGQNGRKLLMKFITTLDFFGWMIFIMYQNACPPLLHILQYITWFKILILSASRGQMRSKGQFLGSFSFLKPSVKYKSSFTKDLVNNFFSINELKPTSLYYNLSILKFWVESRIPLVTNLISISCSIFLKSGPGCFCS